MRIFAKALPKNIKDKYKQNAIYARAKDPEKTIGLFLFNGIILSIVAGFVISEFFGLLIALPLALVFFFFIQMFFFYTLALKADNISKKIEAVLPDALQLMASNLRAGMTTEKALLLSSREEFGELKVELDRVGREITTGRGIVGALNGMAKRFKSEKLKKSVQLINSGLAAGGQLAALLEQIASNLRESEFIEKKVRTNVLMYVIFIFVAIGVGAPTLFALSSFLIEVLTEQLARIDIPTSALESQLPFTISEVGVTPGFVMVYLMIMIITTCILGSLILGLISKGKEKAGVKYIPFLIALAVSLFFIVRAIIKTLLSGIFGI